MVKRKGIKELTEYLNKRFGEHKNLRTSDDVVNDLNKYVGEFKNE